MVINEQQALEIAEVAGYPPMQEVHAFTRALNLAAAMALERTAEMYKVEWTHYSWIRDLADEYRQAAQLNQGETK